MSFWPILATPAGHKYILQLKLHTHTHTHGQWYHAWLYKPIVTWAKKHPTKKLLNSQFRWVECWTKLLLLYFMFFPVFLCTPNAKEFPSNIMEFAAAYTRISFSNLWSLNVIGKNWNGKIVLLNWEMFRLVMKLQKSSRLLNVQDIFIMLAI